MMTMTTGTRRSIWARIAATTVWSESYRHELVSPRLWALFAVVFPLKYLSITLFGTVSVLTSVSPVDTVVSETYGNLWGTALAITSFVSLIGLIFRLYWVELVASVSMTVNLATYPLAVAVLAFTADETARLASALLLPSLLLLPAWRIFDLTRYIRKVRHL